MMIKQSSVIDLFCIISAPELGVRMRRTEIPWEVIARGLAFARVIQIQ